MERIGEEEEEEAGGIYIQNKKKKKRFKEKTTIFSIDRSFSLSLSAIQRSSIYPAVYIYIYLVNIYPSSFFFRPSFSLFREREACALSCAIFSLIDTFSRLSLSIYTVCARYMRPCCNYKFSFSSSFRAKASFFAV